MWRLMSLPITLIRSTATMHTLSRSSADAKAQLERRFSLMLSWLFGMAEEDNIQPRDLELELAKELMALAAMTLGCLFAALCRRLTCKELQQRAIAAEDVCLRNDADYRCQVMTTFGKVSFPLFAYRDRSLGAGQIVTRVPARAAFPYHRRCRSSPLCLEWEVRLGSDHPFRHAQEALTYFTRGAVRLEDTTIVDHMLKVGTLVDRRFLYRTRAQIVEILRNRATRDDETQRPLLYMSSDAHAGRRYVDDTWDAVWKMVNGLRLWCEDRATGRLIHLGGEFTWGDCHAVREAFGWLIRNNLLPVDGDYGEGVHAQLVWLSDGMPWFEDHILPLFDGLLAILDAYHLLDRLAKFAAKCLGKGTAAMRRWYNMVAQYIHGRPATDTSRKTRSSTPRMGIAHSAPGTPATHVHNAEVLPHLEPPDLLSALIIPVVKLMQEVTSAVDVCADKQTQHCTNTTTETARPSTIDADAVHKSCIGLVRYMLHNRFRINYPACRRRGYQIGSGAMESMHRSGSQLRIKVAGARWMAETSQAVFNFRMMRMAGRWDAFWSQPELPQNLADNVRTMPPRYASKKHHQSPKNPLSDGAETLTITG